MFNANLSCGRRLFAAMLVAAVLLGAAFAVAPVARAGGGGCTLVANEHDPSEKILRCGDSLTVQPGAWNPLSADHQSRSAVSCGDPSR